MRGLTKQYLLYVGNFYPHKNLGRLKLAFERLVNDNGPDYCLVLVGGDRYEEKGSVIVTGYVDDRELDNLYEKAAAYVFPSLSEGFGFTPLEAMKRGVAVVSSNTSCLSEILGDAAIYFNPLDVDDIAAKIKKVLLDKELRESLIEKGFIRIKNYDWRKTAEETLNLYRNI